MSNSTVIKRFGVDFHYPEDLSNYSAFTLPAASVSDTDLVLLERDLDRNFNTIHSRTHPSGWTISGRIYDDYIIWVNKFEASHPQYGRVWGDFEHEVEADSEEGFKHFYENHPPNAWDYGDI